jgi:hypothetical protein
MSNKLGGEKKEEKKGLSTKAVVLIILITIIVCGTALAAVLLLREGNTPPAPAPTPVMGGIPVTAENVQEIDAQLEQEIDRGMFETYYSPTWRFPDGSSPASSFLMGNSANNQFPFYFTVILDGENEPIFTSDLLPLGMQLGEIVLDRDLDAGSYPAVINIHMIDDEGAEVESNMGFAVTLIIEN